MPADKDAAKRRRQARNRQERENRQARTEGAKRAATRPSRTAEDRPTSKGRGGTKTSLAKDGGSTAPASGGLLGKLFPPRPEPADRSGSGDGDGARPGRRPPPPSVIVEVEEPASGVGGIIQRALAQPGGKAVTLGLVVGIVCFVTMLVAPVWPTPVLTAVGEDMAVASAQVRGVDEEEAIDDFDDGDLVFVQGNMSDAVPVPIGIAFALLPVAIAGIAFSALTRPTRSRTLMFCALGGVLYFFVSGSLGTYFLPGTAALGWGVWQSRKADQLAAADDED